MQWSEVTAPPPERLLRQFAGLCLAVFGGLAAWRFLHSGADVWTIALGAAALGIGVAGLARPSSIRLIYQTWMIAVFPIGWTISRVILALLFYVVFTPIGVVFRLMGRDVLHLTRPRGASHWVAKAGAAKAEQYFRQF